MNKLLKLSLVSFVVLGVNLVTTLNSSAEVISTDDQVKQIRKTNNFTDNKDEAKKWSNNYYETFNKFLTEDQKDSIALIDDIEANSLWKGVDAKNFPSTPEDNDFAMYLNDLDESLVNRSGALIDDLVVYKTVDVPNYMKMSTDYLFENSTSVNSEHLDELKNSWLGGYLPAYHVFDLTNNGRSTEVSNDENMKIKMELTLPKRTNTGYVDENRIFIDPSEQGFEVDKVSVIIEKNKKYIKVKGHLVQKEQINKIIEEEEDKANNVLNTFLNLPLDTKLVNFRFEGWTATFAARKARDEITNYVNQEKMPDAVKKGLIRFMLADPNGTRGLIFTDKFFGYLGVDISHFTGEQDPNKPELNGLTFFTAQYPNKNYPNFVMQRVPVLGTMDNMGDALLDTLIHEMGHVFDYMSGEKYQSYVLQNRDTFVKQYFNPEKGAISAYGQSHPMEFWAELFKYKYSIDKTTMAIYDNPENFKETKQLFDKLLKSLGLI